MLITCMCLPACQIVHSGMISANVSRLSAFLCGAPRLYRGMQTSWGSMTQATVCAACLVEAAYSVCLTCDWKLFYILSLHVDVTGRLLTSCCMQA